MIDLAAAREKVAARLLTEKEDAFAKPLLDCGTGFDLVCSACKSRRPVVLQCKKRWCPSCARILSADRLDRYQASIDAMQWPLLVTLTMPHTAESSDPSDVRKLRRALGKLRRLRWFQRRVSGGITSIEVTCGKNGWHPHAHMLIDCRWFSVNEPEPDYRTPKDKFKASFKRARREVAEQWALCLGETKRLQVAISRARPEAAREVLKYAVKPQELADSPMPLGPLLKILRVSRLVSAFGSVRESRLAEIAEQAGEERPGVVCACGCSESLPSFVVDRINEVRKIEGDRRRIVSMPIGQRWVQGKHSSHREWIVSA